MFILIIDYLNLPSYIGLKIDDFNLEILNLIFIVLIFIFTYSFIDKRKLEKEKNKNEISKLIMLNSYKECISNISLVTDEIMNDYIILNTDFNKLQGEDENDRISNIKKSPFNNEGILNSLLSEGQINIQHFKKYIEIKRKYESYFTLRLTFYDYFDMYSPAKEECLEILYQEINNLENDNSN